MSNPSYENIVKKYVDAFITGEYKQSFKAVAAEEINQAEKSGGRILKWNISGSIGYEEVKGEKQLEDAIKSEFDADFYNILYEAKR